MAPPLHGGGDVMMRLTAPGYLVLLLPVLVWFWRTGRRRFGSRRIATRCAAVALLIAAASGLQIAAGNAPLTVVFALDVSESMAAARGELQRRLDDLGGSLRPDDRIALILFGTAPLIERPLGAPAPRAGTFAGDVKASGTDIEAALRLARTMLPDDGARRIVLFTDGHQTQGDARREAARLASAGVPVDVVRPSARRAEIAIRHLSAPDTALIGEPFEVTAVVDGPPGAVGEVVLRGQDGVLLRREVRLASDGSAVVTHVTRERASGVSVYRAAIVSPEAAAFGEEELDSAGAVVAVSGEPRLLYVGAHRSQFAAMTGPGFALDALAPADVPRSPASLAGYDAVVMDDVPPDLLDPAQISALAQHVEHRGGGLLVLGSRRSLDAGILPDSQFGTLLPVDFRPRSGVRAPELALVVVFDKSGSMAAAAGGTAKIEFARQGVGRALEAVAATDAVGVIAFDSNPTAVAPLTRNHDRAALAERLRGLEPAGSTAIAPAVRLAREWLAAPDVRTLARRHILLISDGRTSARDEAALRAVVADGQFELSVIALGDEGARGGLGTLAETTGGRAYSLDDVRNLPALVARETARVAGGRVVEESFRPLLTLHPLAQQVSGISLPAIGGYVVSAPKAGTELVLTSHREDPVLATGRHGLGKVAIYTSDLHSDWSRQFRASPASAALLAATMRWLARSATDQAFYVRFRDGGDRVHVTVDVTDAQGDFASLLEAQSSVRGPSGAIERLVLHESLPGRYEGAIKVGDVGAYVVTLAARSVNGAFHGEVLRGFYWSADIERRATGVDDVLLSSLAEVTGGRQLAGDDEPFTNRPPAYRDARPWLLGAAFFVFLGELLLPALARRGAARPQATVASSTGTRHVA